MYEIHPQAPVEHNQHETKTPPEVFFCYNSCMNTPVLESVAKALIVNKNNEVLILTIGEHTSKPEKSHKPDLPGGLVDPGEYEREAVVREIFEETNITVNEARAMLAYSKTEFFKYENKSVSKHLYIFTVDDVPAVTISWEHESYTWIPITELREVNLKSFYDEAIAYCFENNILPPFF